MVRGPRTDGRFSMARERPRVIGLDELLKLRKPLPEKPAPLVYLTDKEFARLTKGAVELPRRPRGAPLAAFEPWPTGGMVQSKCESLPGQTCFGRWTPAGPGRGAGVYLECVCKGIKDDGGKPTPPTPCRARPARGWRISVLGQLPGEPPVPSRPLEGCWERPSRARLPLLERARLRVAAAAGPPPSTRRALCPHS